LWCRIGQCRKEKVLKVRNIPMILRGGDFFDLIGDLIEGSIVILVLAGLLVVAAWGVTRLLPSRRDGRAGSAEEILRERFARGKISAEEYVKCYEVLHETPSRRSYEDYVRDLMDRLRSGRDTGS
jgi:uncharacterized membrane protein